MEADREASELIGEVVLPGDVIKVDGPFKLGPGLCLGDDQQQMAAVKGGILRCRDRTNDPRLYWLDTIEKRVSIGQFSHCKISDNFASSTFQLRVNEWLE